MVPAMGKLGMDPGRRGTMSTQHRTIWHHALAASFAALLAMVSGAAFGCASLGVPGNRLMSCSTNEECKKKDPKLPTCSNLRCVECAYDSDCEGGGVCTNFQCKKLFTSAGEGEPEGPPPNLDACLSRCDDDQACVNKCNDQFRPVTPQP